MSENSSCLSFTINGVEYPLSKDFQEHFIELAEEEDDIIEAWFTGPLFNQRYITPEGEEDVSVIDVIDILETQPDRAEEMLEEVGMLSGGIDIDDGGVELQSWR